MSIEVQNISKTFGTFKALNDVSLSVQTGELVALLGPSGSGKTTLLRIIGGLEQPDDGSGAILFHDEDVRQHPASSRRVGFVFQHYALFRHMTVFENIAFGLRVRPRRIRPSGDVIRQKVHELLELVQLEGLAGRYPHQLSGGQRQRVALARALAVEPKVLLLDEPFGALDAKVRQELRRWLRRLHSEIHLTSLFVTHDQEEALELADRVVITNKGRIEQDGRPEEIIDNPASPFVMNFIGNVNRFKGTASNGRATFGAFTATCAVDGPDVRHVAGYARPHELAVSRSDAGNGLWAVVTHLTPSGPLVRLEATSDDGAALNVDLSRSEQDSLQLHTGDRVYLTFRRLQVFLED